MTHAEEHRIARAGHTRTAGRLSLAAAALALALPVWTLEAAAEARRVTVTSLYPADKPQTLVWVRFRELIEERLPGEYEFRIVTDGALGGEKEEAEGILLGSIQASLSTIANLTTWVPEGALFDMPFMFRDQAHIEAVMAGPLGDEMKSLYKAQGFTVPAFITYGSRNVISKTPIASPEDVRGKTMRVLPSDLHVDLWKSLGANPTAIPITEAYGALETGVVDLMDMTKSGFRALKLFEVAPKLTETNHIWALGVVYFGNNFWDTLPPEHQAVFAEVSGEAAAYFNDLAAEEQDKALQATLEAGAEIIPTDLAAWQKAMEPFWDSYADKVGGIERIRAVVEVAE